MMPDESWLYGSLAALFGLLIGSFLNVVIYRLPKMMEAGWAQEHAEYAAQQEGRSPEELSAPERFNLMVPASRCQSCGHVIRWYENIPVLSWIVLRGKCSSCHALISVRYPLVEIATAVLAWLCFARYGLQISTLVWFAFAAALLCLTVFSPVAGLFAAGQHTLHRRLYAARVHALAAAVAGARGGHGSGGWAQSVVVGVQPHACMRGARGELTSMRRPGPAAHRSSPGRRSSACRCRCR